MASPEHLLRRWTRQVGPVEAFSALAHLIDGACGVDAAVFAVDRDRTIVHWSAGAERLLGFSAEEVLGQHCLKANRCAECMRACGIAAVGEVSEEPLLLHREDGSPVPVRKSAQAFFDEDGAFLGGIEVLVPDTPVLRRAAAEPEQTGGAPPFSDAVAFHGLVSRSPAMHACFDTIRNVARTDSTVLVRGESGTGKELVARAIHDESRRSGAPFMAVNCATLSPTLLESELFGHVRGAFTGAVRDRPGLFRQADGGTIFLDEVAELPLDLQARLLRVIQDRRFMPVGGSKEVGVDVRLVAATHSGLRERARDGRFREDLMYRLRVVPLFLPPLRERPEDIELLLWHFIELNNDRARDGGGHRLVRRVDPAALRALREHDWPGNVRELMNVVEHAFAVGRSEVLERHELPPELREARVTRPLAVAEGGDEAARIRAALAAADGRIGDAAALLGMSRATFWRRRKQLGLADDSP
ncbi:MAG: sigma 54-interacting transcriptional regulator [Alphaproteobacteria bacterium]|nr:sigma 54-interacting transcriptional regulator [Alphaproteobacteria bacterium]